MEENREIDIDLRKVFSMLKKKAIFIVLIALIGATLSGCITNFFIEPQYTATVKLHVYSSGSNRLGADTSITSNEIDASQKLVNTYLVVVESNNFLSKVSDQLNGELSAGAIKGMMSCSQIESTLAFQINVTSGNPQQAMTIANVIADTCPDEIVRVLKVGGVEVIDYATLPTSPSSPNVEKNILIGLVCGFAASFAFFFIKELFDTSITSEKDLEREFDIPVLGTIPRLIPVSDKVKAVDTSKNDLAPPLPGIDANNTKTGDEK
ncbi:MAG: YveK family protein [Eubacterium sp.]